MFDQMTIFAMNRHEEFRSYQIMHQFNFFTAGMSRNMYAVGDVALKKVLREFRLEDCSALSVGDLVKADIFAEGDVVDVTGVSKGKGFAGTIKRYGGARLKETHGTGPVHRHAGSMGACSDPSRIFKGKKMPGQMGSARVTIQNLTVAKIDAENSLIAVKGAVPGPRNSIVTVVSSVKKG